MNATKHLMIEHESVLKMLEIMTAVANQLNNGENLPAGDLEDILLFLRVFVDKCHHGKEENILFPKLVEIGIPNEGGPVGMMLHEHVIGRGYIAGFAAGTAKYKAGDKEGAKEITENIKGYSDLLTSHIFKENNVLYKMADMHLTSQDQTALMERFEQLQEVVLGQGKYEEYKLSLERIAQQYL